MGHALGRNGGGRCAPFFCARSECGGIDCAPTERFGPKTFRRCTLGEGGGPQLHIRRAKEGVGVPKGDWENSGICDSAPSQPRSAQRREGARYASGGERWPVGRTRRSELGGEVPYAQR